MSLTEINPNNSGTITIAGSDIGIQVIDCQLQAEVVSESRSGTYGAPPSDSVGASKWYMNLTYFQDWGATPSLSELLNTNDGQDVAFTFVPTDTAVPSASGTIKAAAGNYGGDAGNAWQVTKRLPLADAPTFTPQP